MEKDYKPISDKHLLALHMIATSKRDSGSFFSDVYAAVSELIDRRKANGEWRGLIDDGHKNEDWQSTRGGGESRAVLGDTKGGSIRLLFCV